MAAVENYWRNSVSDPDHKRVVIFLTDGAPNTGNNGDNNRMWTSLINGTNGIATRLKYYGAPAYGHGTEEEPVGTITITLNKTIAPGEGGLPDAHNTSVTNEEFNNRAVEQYSLNVTYDPSAPKGVEYYTGTYVNPEKRPGAGTDQITSLNTHIINVFEKKLQIEKRDLNTGELLTDSPAVFTLYRATGTSVPTRASDIVSDNGTVSSGYAEVASLTTRTSSNATVDTPAGNTDAYALVPLNFGMFSDETAMTSRYYLVETGKPEGYKKSTQVWPVTLTLSETPTGTAGAEAVASALPYNWTQTAVLTVGEQASADNSNTATVTFRVDNERVVDIEILKVDEKGQPLTLATFKLQKIEGSPMDIKSIMTAPGSTELKYPDVTGVDADSSFTSGTTAVKIENLPDGEYRLVETGTHPGYIILQNEFDFTISNGVISGINEEGVVEFEPADGTKPALITITNEPGPELPSAGGPGTRLFTILGGILTAFAGAMLIRRRQRH